MLKYLALFDQQSFKKLTHDFGFLHYILLVTC